MEQIEQNPLSVAGKLTRVSPCNGRSLGDGMNSGADRTEPTFCGWQTN